MPEITLAAETGRTAGSSNARRLRAEGKIPGIVYGHGTEPIAVAVSAREFRIAMSSDAGLNALLDLDVDGSNYLTLARDIQRHPVRGTVTHVDFQIVRRDQVISAEVGVNLVGEAVEVHHGDGIVEQQLFTLTVRARPADIPNSIEVEISELTIGSSIRVSDLALPPGVEVDGDPEASVVSGLPPRVHLLEGEGVEAAEGVEGEVAAAAGGAEAEAGGAGESEAPSGEGETAGEG